MLKYFKKSGGFKLIKQYAYNGVLFYAIIMFLLLPKNKKGLELFRKSVNTKTYFKFKKKYSKHIKIISNLDVKITPPKIVWFCWLQGLENAPDLVLSCYSSLTNILKDYDIRVVTEKNLYDYVDLPDYIIKKWKNGIITYTHFSDIVRNNLLVRHGGFWIDSTVLLTDKIPVIIENSMMFLFQTLKPGCDGVAVPISSWFISSVPMNPVFMTSQDLLFEYWRKHNFLCDYFLFHNFVQIGLDLYPEIYNLIPKYSNEPPHMLIFNLGKEYNEELFYDICEQSFAHKLTNKLSVEQRQVNFSFYKKILEKK